MPAKSAPELLDLVADLRRPAHLLCDPRGHVLERGGRLDLYGLTDVGRGDFAPEHAACLVGLFPFAGDGVTLPGVQTPSGRRADLHVGSTARGVLVLLLDAQEDVDRREPIQQRGNDLSLLLEKLEVRGGPWQGLDDVLAAMHAAVLKRVSLGRFQSLGVLPEWLSTLCGGPSEALAPGDHVPFLENFLIDAEQLWQGAAAGRARSGVWSEEGADGEELYLEAVAIQSRAGSSYLIVQRLAEAFEERRELLQKARETALRYSGLRRELEKKEVLLRCIVHDLKGPLTGMMGSLSLLRDAQLDPTQHAEVVALGLRQAEKQLGMIRDVLSIFSSELRELDAFHTSPATAPDAAQIARELVAALRSAFAAAGVALRLEVPPEPGELEVGGELKVVGERTRLERILSNLLENALRHTGEGTTVTLGARAEGRFALLWVDDEGPGVAPEVAAHLFEIGRSASGMSGIGLFSCRQTVEAWGGKIGYEPRPEGGAHFWFRLPLARDEWFEPTD